MLQNPEKAALPVGFNDSVAMRARNLRFRGVGNPYVFLDEIGIVPIKEFIYKGANIIDLAETLNLPVTIIRTWIERNEYGAEIEEASVLSAEGYIQQGEKLLKAANTKFDLDKAKAMIEHGRFMASKKDKKTYGNTPDVTGGPAAVSYTFVVNQTNMQLNAVAEKAEPQKVIEADYVDVTPVELDPFNLGAVPVHVQAVSTDVVAVEPADEQ